MGLTVFARQQPLIAATLVIFLLSLAGIPLTAGFLSKFYMLSATVSVGNVWLAVFAVLMAAISVYYYFRLIQAMYFKDGTATLPAVSPAFKITLVAVAAVHYHPWSVPEHAFVLAIFLIAGSKSQVARGLRFNILTTKNLFEFQGGFLL